MGLSLSQKPECSVGFCIYYKKSTRYRLVVEDSLGQAWVGDENMRFTEFVNLLHPVIGAGNSTHAFAKTLFDSIVTEEGQDVLDELSESTYKAYFNGNTEITKLAKKISAYIEPEEFVDYIGQFSDAAVQSLCDSFQEYLADINLHNAGEKLAGLFSLIIKEAASTKKKGTPKGAKNEEPPASSRLNDAVFKSGTAVAEAWNSAVTQLLDNEDDKRLHAKFRTDSDDVLRYIIDHDPSSEATSITLADEIAAIDRTWQYDLRKIKDDGFRKLVTDIIKVLNEYNYYLSEKFLRAIPGRSVLWFRNESLEEGDQLREVLRPQTLRLRKEIAELYKKLFPIPEDNGQVEAETIQAEVVDDNEPSGAADADKEDKKITVIQHQTNVVQNGENNINLTNNGTINFNL